MGNEMGNINTTGIQEEEKAAVEDQENSLQQAAHADDVNRENKIVPAAEGKEFPERVRKLPSHDPTEAEDPLVDDQTFNGKEQADSELMPPPQSPELPMHSSDELSQDSGTQKTSSIDVDGNEKPTKSDLNENLQETRDYQNLEQSLIRREEEEESNATLDVKSAALDPELLQSIDSKSDQCKLSEIHAEPQLEKQSQSQSPEDQKAVIGMSMKCDENQSHSSETEATGRPAATVCSDTDTEDAEKKNAGSQVKEMVCQEEKSSDTGICEEKREIVSRDDAGFDLNKITTSTFNLHNESENKCNGAELPAEMVLSRNGPSKLQSEAISRADSLDPSEEVHQEPHDKCIVLDEGTELIGNGSEDEIRYDPNPTQVYEQAMNELKPEEADPSQFDSITIVSDCDEGWEIVADSTCKTEIDSQIKEQKVAENGSQLDVCHDKQLLEGLEELIEVVPEIGKVPAGVTIIGYNHDEEPPAEKETYYEMENIEEDSNKFASVREVSQATEQHASQSHPVDHTTGFILPSPGSVLQSHDHKPDAVTESETANSNSLLIKQESSEFSVTQASIVDCTKSTEKTLVSAVGQEEDEPEQDLPRHNNTTVAATETLASQSIDQHEQGETFTLASVGCESQEIMGRISIESNQDNSSIHIEFRKSPSFGFDLPLDARSEESDQTPLLHLDKAAARRFPSQDSINFGNSRIKAEYGRDSLQYQAMTVKEKTIKMEKSNSETSRTPFPSFTKEDEQALVVVSPKKQDSHDSDKKEVKEPWSSPAKEVTITSSKVRGKRKPKPKPSLFSTCICCATAIH